MKNFREHSLSIILVVLFVATTAGAWVKGVPLGDYLSNIAGDSYGAFIIVVLTKWFKEQGSAESK